MIRSTRNLRSLAVLAVLASSVVLSSSPAAFANTGGEVIPLLTFEPFEIDGELDEVEWEYAFDDNAPYNDIVADPRDPETNQDWYEIMECNNYDYDPEGVGGNRNHGGLRVTRGTVEDANDLSIRWASAWDEDYLYFGFEVTDESVHEYTGDVNARDDEIDGFWLLFDTAHDAEEFVYGFQQINTKEIAEQSEYDVDDTYWVIAPLTDRDSDGVYEGAAWDASGGGDPELNDPAGGHMAAQITSTGYTAEVRIPWTVLQDYNGDLFPEDGTEMGFDITVMDIDGDPPGWDEIADIDGDPPSMWGGAMSTLR